RDLHRLVFDPTRGMRVAVAEHRQARRKAASGASRAPASALAMSLVAAVGGGVALVAVDAHAQQAGRAPVVFASKLPAPSAPLPQPYGSTFNAAGAPVNATPRPFAYDPAKGAASGDLSKSGQVSWSVNGKNGTFDQGSTARVVINWDSFNIGPGYSV